MNTVSPKDLDVAKEIARRLRGRCKSNIEEILLFGSRAKGIAKPYSDYDFLVVLTHRDVRLIDELYAETQDFELQHQIDVSLKIYGKDDFERMRALGTPFMRSVSKTGIRV